MNNVTGTPYLIFPSRRIMNAESASGVVEIPEWSNVNPYFRLVRSRTDQEGKEIIIFIAPKPLDEMMSDGRPLPVSEELLADWQKVYAGAIQLLDAKELAGTTMSAAESSASTKNAAPCLGDAPPQTIFAGRVAQGCSFLVAVPSKIEQSRRKTQRVGEY